MSTLWVQRKMIIFIKKFFCKTIEKFANLSFSRFQIDFLLAETYLIFIFRNNLLVIYLKWIFKVAFKIIWSTLKLNSLNFNLSFNYFYKVLLFNCFAYFTFLYVTESKNRPKKQRIGKTTSTFFLAFCYGKFSEYNKFLIDILD